MSTPTHGACTTSNASLLPSQEKARIKLKKHKTKYAFIDIGKNLRARDINLTLVWDVMPRVGALTMTARSFEAGKFPGGCKQGGTREEGG
jgi:hypothetical protein